MKKMFVLGLIGLLILSFCSCNAESDVEIVAPSSNNISSKDEDDGRAEKNGFDSSTNETYILASYTIEVPQYWEHKNDVPDGVQRYAETGGKVAMLQLTVQVESDNSYPVTFDGLMEDNDNMISMIEATVFADVTEYEVIDTGVIKGILYTGTIKEGFGLAGQGKWFAFASEEDRSWCSVVMCQTDNTDYLYTDDFMRMIRSIKRKDKQTENPAVSDATPSEIILTMGEDDFKGMKSQDAEKLFREMGFVNFEHKTVDTKMESDADTICFIEITEWLLGDYDFVKGDKFDANSTVTLFSYKYEAPETPPAVFYSTNDYETAKKGNTGMFSYRSRGDSYDIYWIIDFNEGYAYYFTNGNGESTCDKIKIVSGTLNDAVVITYHDGGSVWSYKLHFKYVNHPETLIMVDQNGFDWKYSTTDLDDALALRATKTIKDY